MNIARFVYSFTCGWIFEFFALLTILNTVAINTNVQAFEWPYVFNSLE